MKVLLTSLVHQGVASGLSSHGAGYTLTMLNYLRSLNGDASFSVDKRVNFERWHEYDALVIVPSDEV